MVRNVAITTMLMANVKEVNKLKQKVDILEKTVAKLNNKEVSKEKERLEQLEIFVRTMT